MALLAVLALAGCQSTADVTAPRLDASTPADGARDVPLSTPLTLIASEGMDAASVRVAATPFVDLGAGAWLDERTVRYAPTGGWRAGSHYAVTLSGRDRAGNDLPPTTIAFDTVADGTPPARPTNVHAEADDASFTVSWDPGTDDDLAGVTVYWGEDPAAPAGALFVPAPGTNATVGGVVDGTTYSYAVEAQDASGNRSERVSGTVTPRDATPPTLVSSDPADGAADVSSPGVVDLTFSEPMAAATLSLGLCTGTAAPEVATCANPAPLDLGPATWSGAGSVASFAAGATFADAATYVLVVSGTDVAGNDLAPPATVAFSVRATQDSTPPSVVADDPVIDLDRGTGSVVLHFSEPMDQASVEAAFLSQPQLGCAWSWQASDATCTMVSGLTQLTAYDLAVGVGAADTAGNHLSFPYPFSFNTGNFTPRLVGVSPRNGAFNAPTTAPLVLTFSEPMDQDSVAGALTVLTGGAPVAGVMDWALDANGSVARFTPNAPYGNGQTVQWTVDTSAREAGVGRMLLKSLAAPVSGSFVTRLANAP